ncbi:MAG TPA: hypothetical protein VFV10_06745 [Gammaproteobacteria bacterium]|nr:hypothetical protein [Gammaproteobacteria bacterium]
MGIRSVFGVLSLALACAALPAGRAAAAESFAVVALVDDAKLRAEIEDGVAAELDGKELEVQASHGLAEDVSEVASKDFLAALRKRKIEGILALRPAPVGEETSLTSVRAAITPEMLRDFRDFAKRVSRIGASDAPIVMHIGVYSLGNREPELLTAGATWLEKEPASREEAVKRLDELVALNVERATPQIREALSGRAGGKR